jgi:hypothetical protein
VQKLYGPIYRFLQFCIWLAQHWPASKNKRTTELSVQDTLFSIRMVFILWRLNTDLKSVKISVDDLSIYSKWVDFRNCSEELIIQVC